MSMHLIPLTKLEQEGLDKHGINPDGLPSQLADVFRHGVAWALKESPKLAVWYGSMPESNGKTNWTAILYRKGREGFLGGIAEGLTIARSEYPDRVRYEADCVRYLIGEITEKPFILDYDSEKHSGYVEVQHAHR